jgi:hypothetical protein
MWDSAYAFGRRAAGRVARSVIPARSDPSLFFRDAALLDQVEDCIHSIPMLRDIVAVDRCDKLLARTRAGECPSEELLGCLTSLSLSAAVLRG